MTNRRSFKCKCCCNETLPVPPEEAIAFICPICFWENDVFTSDEDEPSDENHGLTLAEGRKNYGQYGICDPRLREPTGRAPSEEILSEIQIADDTRIIGGSHNRKTPVLPEHGENNK